MAQQPKDAVEINDFLGLVSNFDEHDLPAGAALDQVNAAIIRQAELQIRRGYKELTFED